MQPKPSIDLRGIINEMADEYQRLHRLQIDQEAREVLIAPALEHQKEVEEELESGKLTVNIIRDKVMEQLSIAERTARRRSAQLAKSASADGPPVTGQDATDSMKEECALMFWC